MVRARQQWLWVERETESKGCLKYGAGFYNWTEGREGRRKKKQEMKTPLFKKCQEKQRCTTYVLVGVVV